MFHLARMLKPNMSIYLAKRWYHKFYFSIISTSFTTHPLLTPHPVTPPVFVQIHVLAYILTRSVHVPGGIDLAATLLGLNPNSSKTLIYQGFKPELRISTRPPSLSARLTALHCAGASGPPGGNQSMLSMRTAIVRASGCMRAKTSASSSVWMRMLSRAVGVWSLRWDLGVR